LGRALLFFEKEQYYFSMLSIKQTGKDNYKTTYGSWFHITPKDLKPKRIYKQVGTKFIKLSTKIIIFILHAICCKF